MNILSHSRNGSTAYDEQLVRKLIEKTTVYDDHLDFLFKLGIQIEIKG